MWRWMRLSARARVRVLANTGAHHPEQAGLESNSVRALYALGVSVESYDFCIDIDTGFLGGT